MLLCEKADAGDLEGIKRIMEEAAKHYGGTKEALERSDRVIKRVLPGRRQKDGGASACATRCITFKNIRYGKLLILGKLIQG